MCKRRRIRSWCRTFRCDSVQQTLFHHSIVQAEEDKVAEANRLKQRLESTLDDLEERLEHERRAKQDLEKSKRKLEGEMRVLKETLDEANRVKAEKEQALKNKEAELQVCHYCLRRSKQHTGSHIARRRGADDDATCAASSEGDAVAYR